MNIAMEYARDGIRVNTVAPGVVDTPLHKDNPVDFLKTLSPMNSTSSAQEIVDAVVFLTEARISPGRCCTSTAAHIWADGNPWPRAADAAGAEQRLKDWHLPSPPADPFQGLWRLSRSAGCSS